MTDKPPPVIRSDAEAAAWSRVVAAELSTDTPYQVAIEFADAVVLELRARIDRGKLEYRAKRGDLRGLGELRRVKATPDEESDRAEMIAAQEGSDPLTLWPPCSACGKPPGDPAHRFPIEHAYTPGDTEPKGTV